MALGLYFGCLIAENCRCLYPVLLTAVTAVCSPDLEMQPDAIKSESKTANHNQWLPSLSCYWSSMYLVDWQNTLAKQHLISLHCS